LGTEDSSEAVKILKKLNDSGFQGAGLEDLTLSGDVERTADILGFLRRTGKLKRVGSDRYYDVAVINQLIDVVVKTASRVGEISPADLREETGLTRKYLIPLLEWMDVEGITARMGAGRVLGPRGRIAASETVDKG
jgi:selenocysteine-specific elongation factor